MQPQPSHPEPRDVDRPELLELSSLADGEALLSEQACRRWRDDPQAQRAWLTYHLIGDVMRSEDLARPLARDAAFLAAVKARLATEPVVLAPGPSVRRAVWPVPAAAAAGFLAVAAVLLVMRYSPDPASAPMAAATRQAPAGRMVSTGPQMLRDPVLDQFVRDHRAVGNSVAVAAPGGNVRQVELTLNVAADR
jgi:sigma-E factor negative regulatory protein RseA